jgi:GTP-binding protein YchF
MEIGIIGLPRSGKTTLFNALTKGVAQTGEYSSAASAPNIGVVKVPDPRLDRLTWLFNPRRTVPAEVTYIDIAAPAKGLGRGEGPGGQLLSHLSKADTLAHVVRAFANDSVPHSEGSVDPDRDIATMDLELAFSDLGIIERRLERLNASLKGAKAQNRELIAREESLLRRIKDALESEVPIREQALSEHDAKLIRDFQFLTAKPLLLVINIGEGLVRDSARLDAEYGGRYRRENCEVAVLCGQVEMELAQLDDADAVEFRESLGLKESGLERMIRVSYGMLGLASFFTVGSDEVRAWTVRRDTPIQKAAGKVHSDMERGFIRAEVIGFDDLDRCGSIAEARKQGLLRLEGKNYPVTDGDVVTILFNV